MPKLTARLLLAMFYLGVLFFGAGFVMRRVQSFDGVIIVEQGQVERWATSPAGEGRSFSTAHRNMPAEVIGFDNPRASVRILGTRDQFDAAPLPYRLRLADVAVLERRPDKHTLEIIQPGETHAIEAQPEQAVLLPEGRITLRGIEPWRGLLRDARGEPMAAVSLKPGDESWSPVVFVDTKSVTRPLPLLAVALHWYPDEAQARAAFGENAPPTIHTRWGVNDVGRITWFETITPGAGVTTSDGSEYMLLEVIDSEDASQPPVAAIIAGRKTESGATRIRVEANSESPDGDIVLESFRDDAVIRLHAWRDGAALAKTFSHGEAQETVLLNEGDTLDMEVAGQPLRFRLDQVMGAALSVLDGDALALTLETPDGELRLREGQSAQLQESRLRFRRVQQPALVRYTLQAMESGQNETPREFVLSPGERRRIGSWRFTHDVEHLDNETIAILRAERVPGTPAQYFGGLMFLVGALGLTIFRFAGWHSIGREDAATIMEEDEWTPVPLDDDIPVNRHNAP